MLINFGDIVSASLFAARKNDEGYFAEILHLHSGHMYGPLPSMGFAVLVSDYAAQDEDEVPEKDVSIPIFLHYIGVILCLFSATVVMLLLAYLAWVVCWTLIGLLLADVLFFMLLCLCLFLVFSFLSLYVMCLMKMIPAIRDGTKVHHHIFRIMIAIWVFAVVIFQM